MFLPQDAVALSAHTTSLSAPLKSSKPSQVSPPPTRREELPFPQAPELQHPPHFHGQWLLCSKLWRPFQSAPQQTRPANLFINKHGRLCSCAWYVSNNWWFKIWKVGRPPLEFAFKTKSTTVSNSSFQPQPPRLQQCNHVRCKNARQTLPFQWCKGNPCPSGSSSGLGYSYDLPPECKNHRLSKRSWTTLLPHVPDEHHQWFEHQELSKQLVEW